MDFIEYLTRDPIIEAYFNFRNANEDNVPVFSETVLRLAVKHVLQSKNQREGDVLNMYRKLMTTMLYFNSGKTIDELEEIMTCFKRSELIQILKDAEHIDDNWKIFTVEEMTYFIRKNAFFIIMSEWTRRYACLYGKPAITDEKLGDMTLRIHDYYNWPVKSVHQWKRSFESKFLRGNSKEFDDHDMFDIKNSDLTIRKISADLNDKLHPLIHEDNYRNFVYSIKSIDEETANRLQVFKRRRKDDDASIAKVNIADKDKFAEQTIEMFIKTDEIKRNGKKNDAQTDDEDVEYVHVVEITDEDNDLDDDDSTSNTNSMSAKHIKTETDDDSDWNEEIDCKELNKNTNDENDIPKTDQSNSCEMINDEQATKYLSALQAYAVVNGLFEAIGLLDQVDSIFRTKFEKDT